jgi:hypothetical protein
MPLNQSQRNEIEKSISHFFYGLAVTPEELAKEITALRLALDKGLLPPPKPQKPSEEKEREEKYAQPETAFAQLTKVIQEIESSLKGLENRNADSRITLNEVIEYIIFYSICRLQFHLQFLAREEEPEDDFKINEWLLPIIAPAENSVGMHDANEPAESPEDKLAKNPWQLQAWLAKTNAKTAMEPLGWNIETTFALLQNLQEKPFETHKPPVDYGSYNFNWELPSLNQRMYTVEIKERWVQPKDITGKIISCTPYIDLHINAQLSRHKKFEKILPAFKPYPNVPIFDRDTPRQIEQKFLAAEEVIKNAARAIAEKEAIKLIIGHLENLDHIPSNSEAQLRENSVSSASTVPYEYDADGQPPEFHNDDKAANIDDMPELESDNEVVAPDSSSSAAESALQPGATGNAATIQAATALDNLFSGLAQRSAIQPPPLTPKPLNINTRHVSIPQEIKSPAAHPYNLFLNSPRLPSLEQPLHPPSPFNLAATPPHTPMSGDSSAAADYYEDNPMDELDLLSAHGAEFSPIPPEFAEEEKAGIPRSNPASNLPITNLPSHSPHPAAELSATQDKPDNESGALTPVLRPRSSTPDPREIAISPAVAHAFDLDVLPSFADDADAPGDDNSHALPPLPSTRFNAALTSLFGPAEADEPDEELAEDNHSSANPVIEHRAVPAPAIPHASAANSDRELPPSFGAEVEALAREFAADNSRNPNADLELPLFFMDDIAAIQSEADNLATALDSFDSDRTRRQRPPLPPLPAVINYNPPNSIANRVFVTARSTQRAGFNMGQSRGFSIGQTRARPRIVIKHKPIEPPSPPGLVLATHTYYYEEIKAGRMSLLGLETFSPAEVENLMSPAVIMFQKLHLIDRSVAMSLPPGCKRLLETPGYSHYFRLHPEALASAMNVTPEVARRLASPYITNLLERERYSLDYLLTLTSEELTIANNAVYGELFYRLADGLPMIKGITVAEQNFLLEETVRGLIEKNLLTIPAARALINGNDALAPFQLDIIRDLACSELFLTGRFHCADLNLIQPAQAENLRDPKVIELMEKDILPINDGINLTPANKALYCIPGINKFLLEKILTPQQAQQLPPMMRVVLNTEPYTTILAKKPEFIGLLQQWSQVNLECLFAPTILRLFANNVLSLEHLRNPGPNFFAILSGSTVCNLLIDKKITLPQALSLTPVTWREIEENPKIAKLLRNNRDNNQQLDYLPFKIWSHHLSLRLFDLYRDIPQKFGQRTDTLDIIKAQFDSVAHGENISRNQLLILAVELLLRDIRDEIEYVFRRVSTSRIPAVYRSVLSEINRAASSRHPDWLQTLAQLTRHADNGLDDNPRNRPVLHYQNNHPLRGQRFFREPYEMTNSGIRSFCHNILAITSVHEPEQQPVLQHQHSYQ